MEFDPAGRWEIEMPDARLGFFDRDGIGLGLAESQSCGTRRRWRFADERLRLAYAGVAESAQLNLVGFRQRHLRGLGSAAHGNQRRCRLDGYGESGRSEKCFMGNILR